GAGDKGAVRRLASTHPTGGVVVARGVVVKSLDAVSGIGTARVVVKGLVAAGGVVGAYGVVRERGNAVSGVSNACSVVYERVVAGGAVAVPCGVVGECIGADGGVICARSVVS